MTNIPTKKLRTGQSIPHMGLGTWQLTDSTKDTVLTALDLGYRLIDTSSDYGTHKGIGQALKETSVDRENIFLVTKVEETDDAYKATKDYLKELQQDYADLILIHRPPPSGTGKNLWEGLIRAKKEGMTKNIGVSNYSIDLIEKLISATDEVPVVNQIEWSPFGFSDKMKKYCDDKQIVIQAYSPLTRAKRLDNERCLDLCKKYKKSSAQILLRWSLQKGAIPLPKANQTKHLEENIKIFDFELSEPDMATLDSLNEHYSTFGDLPYI